MRNLNCQDLMHELKMLININQIKLIEFENVECQLWDRLETSIKLITNC